MIVSFLFWTRGMIVFQLALIALIQFKDIMASIFDCYASIQGYQTKLG